MTSLGITGGIGTGKSEVAAHLGRLGVPVLDTDAIARDLVEPGCPALSEIVDAFGGGLLEASGRLDRAALATLVFADVTARQRLEDILHPRIFEAWMAWLDGCRRRPGLRVAAVVIPLLFEKGYSGRFDRIAAVACSPATQRRRLLGRGWTEVEIDQRLAAQWPMADKFRRADFGLWSEGCLEVLQEQVQAVTGSLPA